MGDKHVYVNAYGFALCILQVKAAILSTLGIIIDKGGVALRSFLPQLQPTFVKSLSDANKVRVVCVCVCVTLASGYFAVGGGVMCAFVCVLHVMCVSYV